MADRLPSRPPRTNWGNLSKNLALWLLVGLLALALFQMMSRQRNPTQEFSYTPVGMLASIGNHKAVGLVFGVKVSGFPAWFLWRSYYLTQMPLIEKRVRVMFNWTVDLVAPPALVQLKVGQPAPMAERSDSR